MIASATSIITAVAVLVLCSAAFIAIVMIGRRMGTLTARMGNLEVTASAIKVDTTGVARAVNHVPDGHPTLLERVQRLEEGQRHLEDGQRWEHDSLCKIAASTGVTLTQSPLDRRVP